MRKAITILLALVMVLSLAACGGGSTTTNTPAATEAPATPEPTPTSASSDTENPSTIVPTQTDSTPANDNSIIEFQNTILFEDDIVAIELLSFYAETMNWNSGAQEEKIAAFKIHNKSDFTVYIDIEDTYVGEEAVIAGQMDGTMEVASGKAGTFRYYFNYNTVPNPTALGSVDDLYLLEGVFSIIIDKNTSDFSADSMYSVPFSMNSAK